MKKEIIIAIIITLIIISAGGFIDKLWIENRNLKTEIEYWKYLTNLYLNANYQCEEQL